MKINKVRKFDLVLDRNDHVINLIEIKFYNTEFTLTQTYAKNLRNKMRIFQEVTKTRKQLFITLNHYLWFEAQ